MAKERREKVKKISQQTNSLTPLTAPNHGIRFIHTTKHQVSTCSYINLKKKKKNPAVIADLLCQWLKMQTIKKKQKANNQPKA